MTRTGQAAIDYARSRVGGTMPDSGLCLQFVRTCFDVGSYYYSAIDAWNAAADKHPGDYNPPPAVPLYFRTPSPYDHVVFGCSTGEIISTFNADIRSYSSIYAIEAAFDGTYLGWAGDINRVDIYNPPPPEDDVTPDEVKSACEEAIKGVLRAPEFQGYMRDLPWQYPINGPDPASWWLRDARLAPELNAGIAGVSDQVDELAASSSLRTWPSTLALILAVAVIAGLLAGLISQVVETGAVAGAATLLGGLVGWAATTLGQRIKRHRGEATAP
jgi:hypothetical protein